MVSDADGLDQDVEKCGVRVELRLLGLVELCSGGGPVAVGPPEVCSVLGVLAMAANSVVQVDSLTDLVWGGAPPPDARDLLHEHITRLRNVLAHYNPRGTVTLIDHPDGYSLAIDLDQVDLHLFHQLLAERLAARRPPRIQQAVHRTILVVDVEGFGDTRRTNTNRVSIRDGVYRAVREAFRDAGIPWNACHHEDRGDGVLILAPPEVPKAPFVESLPHELVNALRRHNEKHVAEERIRLRMALNAGEVHRDSHGVIGASINTAFRLLDAQPFKAALAASPGVLVLIASAWFYDDVVRQSPASHPESYRPVNVAVKETTTVAWVCLPDYPYSPGETELLARPSSAPIPRQLPAYSRHFVGRTEEIRRLNELTQDTKTVVITAIDGAAGMGKTTLAVRWAYQVAEQFPDGQLYVNLRGFDPTGSPMRPAEAVHGFLGALGVPPEQIPAGLDAQAALYRTVLADRCVLVVLDNASDSDQVRPLLPGSSHCFVVITTRAQMSSLVTGEGAYPLTLDVLSRTEAKSLLARRLGMDRLSAEANAVDDVLKYCDGLPLALAIVAARAAMSPRLSLQALAGELRDEQNRLDALESGDLEASVRAVFSWSYQRLDTRGARMFRLLGLHPGPDFSVAAAASLAGVPVDEARSALNHLVRANLVHEHPSGRFDFHDLLRAYAADQAGAVDSADIRADVLNRMFDYYLTTAHAADRLLHPHREPLALAEPPDDIVREQLMSAGQAWTWFSSEHPVLLAAIEQAERTGQHSHAWQILWSVATFLQRGGQWHDLATSGTLALAAAQRANDRSGEAQMRSSLGYASVRLGAFEDGRTHFEKALEFHRESDDKSGQARTFLELAWAFWQQDSLPVALEHAEQALELYRDACHQAGEADALNDVGWYHSQLGDHREALACCDQALELHRALGDRVGQAATCNSLGYAYHHLGDHPAARTAYQRALELYRELGNRYEEAVTLVHLGNTCYAAGDFELARDSWQDALVVFERLGHISAHQVRADLDRLPSRETSE